MTPFAIQTSSSAQLSVLKAQLLQRSLSIANAGSHAGVAHQYGHDALLYIQRHDARAKPTPVQALLASYPRFGDHLTAAQIAKLEDRQVAVQGRSLDMQLHALYTCADNLLSGNLSASLKSTGEFIHMNLVKGHTAVRNSEAIYVQQGDHRCSNFCLQQTAISSMSTSCSNYLLADMHERVHFSLQDQHYIAGCVSAWHHNILQCYAMPWCRESEGAAEAGKAILRRHNRSGCLAVCVS